MKVFFKNQNLKTNLTKYANSVKFFSAASAKTTDTPVSRFHDIYIKELERLKHENHEIVASQYKVNQSAPLTEAYVHPYHSTRFPVYWSSANIQNFLNEAAGTEPVSPHYESFVRSRRAPLAMFGVIWIFAMIEGLNMNSIYGHTGLYQLYTLIGFSILTLEVRYITQKLPAPRLTWYYAAFLEHEYKQLILNWQDRMIEAQKKFLSISKEQIDYYLIHKEFSFIKKRSLSNYLNSQKQGLDKFFFERTNNLLKSIERIENQNISDKIKQIAEESYRAVINKINDPQQKKSFHENSFQSALDGLRTGKMQYKNDPILPLLINEVRSRVDPLRNLSPHQENEMFGLSADQRKMLIDNENRAKVEYLTTPPDVSSGAVKNTEIYKSITQRMKQRIETAFK